jgi:hypothetical protein
LYIVCNVFKTWLQIDVSGNSNAIQYPRIIAAIDVRPNLIVATLQQKNRAEIKFTGHQQLSSEVHEKQVEETGNDLVEP